MISQDVSLQNMDFQDEDIQRAVSLYENLNATACYYTAALRSPDGLGPVRGVFITGRGGLERVRGDVKRVYSAGELLKAPVPNEP